MEVFKEQGKEIDQMKNQLRKMDCALQRAKSKLMEKREGSDQLIVMFIIIAVAAGIAGLLYIFGKTTLLQDKLTNLINDWFNHA